MTSMLGKIVVKVIRMNIYKIMHIKLTMHYCKYTFFAKTYFLIEVILSENTLFALNIAY